MTVYQVTTLHLQTALEEATGQLQQHRLSISLAVVNHHCSEPFSSSTLIAEQYEAWYRVSTTQGGQFPNHNCSELFSLAQMTSAIYTLSAIYALRANHIFLRLQSESQSTNISGSILRYVYQREYLYEEW